MNGYKTDAEAAEAVAISSAATAQSSANFKGDWSDQTGAAAIPYSVYHEGNYWQLVSNLADVTASEPGVTAAWKVIGGVILADDLDQLQSFSVVDGIVVYLKGRTATGDGGQGVFIGHTGDYTTQVTADTLAGIYAPSSTDPTGSEGCWIREDTEKLTPQMFGAIGDGSVDDTLPVTAWLYMSIYTNTSAKLPSGTYLTDPIILSSYYAGLKIEGTSPNYFSGTFGVNASVLKLRSSNTSFVTLSGCSNINVSGITFDGAGLCDNLIYWPGTQSTTIQEFYWCTFYGAKADTGYTHRYAGTIQADHITFSRCMFKASESGTFTDPIVGAHVYITNSNTLFNIYQDCKFFSSKKVFRFGAGSCNMINCQYYFYTEQAILVDNITQPFMCVSPYTEQTNGLPFFYQAATAGGTGSRPITILNPDISSTGAYMVLSCQQPVVIIGGFIPGGVTVNPVATYGIHPVSFDSVHLNTGSTFGGTGSLTHVIKRSCSIGGVLQRDSNVNGTLLYSDKFEYDHILADAGATPDLSGGASFVVSNTGAQNITGFTGGEFYKVVSIRFGDANSTLVHSSDLVLEGSTNVTPTANSVIGLKYTGDYKWVEVSRSIK